MRVQSIPKGGQRMSISLWLIAIASGLAAGAGSFVLFLRIPEKWIRDYEPDDEPQIPLPEPRLRFLPYGLLWILLCIALSAQAVSAYGPSPVAFLCVLSLVPLAIVFVADFMTRIIPDQAVIALAFLGVLFWCVSRFAPGTAVVPGSLGTGFPWYLDAANRIGGALLGGLFLLAVGYVGSRLAGGVDAMGMGDVKLLAAAGLLVGVLGLLPLFLVAFVTGAVFAIPALIRKYGHRGSSAGSNTNGDTDGEEPSPGRDGTMPFGPFLVIGVLTVLFFGNFLSGLAGWYLSLF